MKALEKLEAKVAEAAEELARLRAENAELGKRLAAAEERVAAAEGEGEDGEGWAAERAEVRRRVEALVARLDELVAD